MNSVINQIELFKPDLLFIWLQFKPFNYKLIEICRDKNIDIRFIHEGCIPGSISIERFGMMGESENTKEFPKAIDLDKIYLKNAARIISEIKTNKYSRKKSNKSCISKIVKEKYLLVLGGCDNESGIRFVDKARLFKHSPLGIDSLDLLTI